MQPSQQATVGYTFAQGAYSSGLHTIDLAADYDFYIDSITVFAAPPPAGTVIFLAYAGGDTFWAAEGTLARSGDATEDIWKPGLIIPAGNNLEMNLYATNSLVSISGYVLSPSRATIFG